MEETFLNYLQGAKVEPRLQEILLTLAGLFPQVARALQTSHLGYAESHNSYGEQQLKLDVYSQKIFEEALKKNPAVSLLASEELENEIECGGGADGYSLAFDPLDGSSLVDVNLAVGSIFGIYKGKGFIGRKGSEQVAALIVVYGPRLTFTISTGEGVFEFLYKEDQKEFVANGEVKLAEEKKMFAPGNLRACSSEGWYLKLLEYWVKNEYTLRYSGGMVPDVNQILRKGGGVFTYPGYKEKPEGKLRLLYECAPVAYLIEKAGGVAVNGKGRILEMVIEKLDQRTPIFLGSAKEVELAVSYMK